MKTTYPAIAILCLCSTAAQAQEIDYEQFEELFGEPVVTSVTGTPQRASELPAATIIVKGDDIRRSGATNLAEALRGYAGIDVARPSTGQYDLSIRGQVGVINANTLVLVNGRQVYLEHLGYTNWASLGVELEEIRQVEIVKGPNSAIFGFNAASGVINIVTFNPVYDDVSRATVQVGPDDRFNVSGVVTVPLGENGGVRVSAGLDKQERFPGNIFNTERFTEARNVGVDAGYDFNGKAFVRVGYNYSEADQLISLGQSFSPESDLETENFHGSLTAEVLGGSMKLSAQVSDVTQDLDFDGNGTLEISYTNDLEIYTAQFQRKLAADTTIRINGEYRESDFLAIEDLAGGGRGPIGNADYSSWAASLMVEQNITERLTLTGAVRFDSLDVSREVLGNGLSDQLILQELGTDNINSDIDEVSYNLSAIYRASDNVTLRAQAARGTKLPSQLQFGLQQTLNSASPPLLIAFGNPTLPAAVSDSYEVGANVVLPSLGATATVSAFYTEYDDVSNFTQTDPIFVGPLPVVPLFYQVVGDYQSYGVEVSLDARDGEGFDWRLDYTFNEVAQDFTDNLVGDTQVEGETPSHKLRAELGFNAGPFNINAIGLYRSGVEYDGVTGVVERDGSVQVDARAGYLVSNQIEVFAVGENLTGSEVFGNGAIEQDTRVRVGARFAM